MSTPSPDFQLSASPTLWGANRQENALECRRWGRLRLYVRSFGEQSAVSGHTYDMIVKLVREYGRYPLCLGEFKLPDIVT